MTGAPPPPVWRATARRGVAVARGWATWVRASPRPPHRVVVTSVPKAGTTLVTKALLGLEGLTPWPFGLTGDAMPRAEHGEPSLLLGVDWPRTVSARALRRRLRVCPPGLVAAGHVPWSSDTAALLHDLDARVVAVVRDPRDVAVSLPPYVLARPDHFLHRRFVAMDEGERLLAAIAGLPPDADGSRLQPLADRFHDVLRWSERADGLLVRFEDLVGARGGGSDTAQRATVHRLAAHVGVPVDDARATRIADGLFGGTATFRRGRVGGWRETFDERHLAAAERLTPLLVELGYEDDEAWTA